MLQHHKGNANIELVSNLIEEENRTWKVDIIFNTFNANIAKKKLLIPVARSVHDDFQVWGREPSGNFSVGNAYKLLQKPTLVPSNNIIPRMKLGVPNVGSLRRIVIMTALIWP